MEPVCIVCFHSRFSPKQPTVYFSSYEKALQMVRLRLAEIECVMVNGEVFQRKQHISSREEYHTYLNSFQDPCARQIFYLVVGPYRRHQRK